MLVVAVHVGCCYIPDRSQHSGYPTLVPGPCVIGSTVWEASSKNRQNCTEFDAPSMMFPYFTPSYPTRKFRVRFAVDKYLRASTQSSPTGEKPKFL